MSLPRSARLAAVALALVVVVRPVSAQALFEGQVTLILTSPRGAIPTELYMKDGMTRMDVAGPGGGSMTMVTDPSKKEMLIIMPERQMYMRRSTDMAGMAMPQGAPPMTKPTITKTGKMETIAGISCEHYTITHEGGESEDACLASGMGTFSPGGGMMGRGMGGGGGGGQGGGRGPGGGGRQELGWARDLDKGMFPLKVVKNGATVMEVTKVEKKKLDPTLFQAPEGFQDASGMMGGGRPGRPPAT